MGGEWRGGADQAGYLIDGGTRAKEMENMCAEGACCSGKELLVRQHCPRFDMIDRRARQEACGHTKAIAGVQKGNLTMLSP